ncbi:hypothetical protein BC830DRAFT_245406 [Chytriomyces sp. MP71]|nr:hypothetical protein BC830DRAFT_245406 [Chytriomyces sp. MP71]
MHLFNPLTGNHEIHILPWVIQIVYGLAYLIYSQNKGDVFLFVQAIPPLMAGMAQTLHWHPFYNKKIRKFHEYLLFICMGVLYILTATTTIYFHANRPDIGEIASGVMTLLFAVLTVVTMLAEKWRLFQVNKPKVLEIVMAGACFINAGFWTTYGFYGEADWVVCAAAITWLVYSLLDAALISYGMYNNGGLETGGDTDDDEDSDVVVDRFNRAPTIDGRSMQAYAPEIGYGSAPGSSRMSMGRMEMEDMQYLSDHAGRMSRRGPPMQQQQQPVQGGMGPDFSVAYSP